MACTFVTCDQTFFFSGKGKKKELFPRSVVQTKREEGHLITRYTVTEPVKDAVHLRSAV